MKQNILANLNIPIIIADYKKKTSLPRYLTQGRLFYVAEYEQFSFMIIEVKESPKDSRVAASELKKYQSEFGKYVAFCFPEMTRPQRNAYIKHNIPFIFSPVQVYLPFLGIILSEYFPKIQKINAEKMTVITQQVFLFLIYHIKKQYAKSDLAKGIGTTPASVTRATEQLKTMGLIDEWKQGKNVYICRSFDGLELFEKAQNYLQNPIKELKYIQVSNIKNRFPAAGITALSALSMLNPPEVQVRACYYKDPYYDYLQEVNEPHWQDPKSICLLEAWKYNPNLFAFHGKVDPVSLYCTLTDEKDVRVRNELENILEEYKWQ